MSKPLHCITFVFILVTGKQRWDDGCWYGESTKGSARIVRGKKSTSGCKHKNKCCFEAKPVACWISLFGCSLRATWSNKMQQYLCEVENAIYFKSMCIHIKILSDTWVLGNVSFTINGIIYFRQARRNGVQMNLVSMLFLHPETSTSWKQRLQNMSR